MKEVILSAVFALLTFAGFAQTSPQDYTVDSTFTVPVGVTSITVELVGAGGKGINNGGGGGGGGGYAKGVYTVTPGTTLSITVGSISGGSTSAITSLGIQATGGANGISLTSQPYMVGGGGAGGIGSGGTISNFAGGNGGGGRWTYFGGGGGGAAGSNGNGIVGVSTINWTGSCNEPGGAGGASGGFPGGDGGKGAGYNNGSCTSQNINPAAIGVDHGGGGGAGNGNGSPGVDGAAGFVRISWGINTGIASTPTARTTTFPNPFTNKINVSNCTGTEHYTLVNVVGEIVWSGPDIDQQEFSSLSKGIYLLRIATDNIDLVQRIIKQ